MFTFPVHHKITSAGQYYSTRAVSSDGKIEKQNVPKKRRHVYCGRIVNVKT
jgi:hypothetical protein